MQVSTRKSLEPALALYPVLISKLSELTLDGTVFVDINKNYFGVQERCLLSVSVKNSQSDQLGQVIAQYEGDFPVQVFEVTPPVAKGDGAKPRTIDPHTYVYDRYDIDRILASIVAQVERIAKEQS